jgi:hypothetical protein
MSYYGRPRHKWEDNIKMDPKEIEHEDVDWFHLTQERVQWQALVITVMNFQVQYKMRSFLTS